MAKLEVAQHVQGELVRLVAVYDALFRGCVLKGAESDLQSVKYMFATGLPGIIAPPTIWMGNWSDGWYPTVA